MVEGVSPTRQKCWSGATVRIAKPEYSGRKVGVLNSLTTAVRTTGFVWQRVYKVGRYDSQRLTVPLSLFLSLLLVSSPIFITLQPKDI